MLTLDGPVRSPPPNRIRDLLPAEPPAVPGHIASHRRLWVWIGVGFALLGTIAVLWISRQRAAKDLHNLVAQVADSHGLEPALIEAIVQAESSGNPRAASRAQAYGLMQLQIPTASEVAGRPLTAEDLFEPRLNVDLGCRYLNQLLDYYNGDRRLALMAYNAGMGRVDGWRRITRDTDEILAKHAYPATRAYVHKVLRLARSPSR